MGKTVYSLDMSLEEGKLEYIMTKKQKVRREDRQGKVCVVWYHGMEVHLYQKLLLVISTRFEGPGPTCNQPYMA